MKIHYLILMLGWSYLMQAQMPRDDDYSNWDWENQNQNNWQRKLGAGEADPEGDGDGWANIAPPFAPGSSRVGDIVDVYIDGDYTKSKGWKLIWAHFNSIYPYFILYHTHLGLVRTFFYLDNITAFDDVVATLSFHRPNSNNPGILNSKKNGVWATDKYLSGSQTGASDLMAVVIPNVGLKSWCSADFPILLDNNIKNNRYNDKKWVFKFYGSDNYGIYIKGTSTPPPGSDDQHTISGGDPTINSLSAQQAQFHKQLKSTTSFLNEMKNSANSINENSPKFLQKYKSKIQQIGSIAEVFDAAVGISSGAGAVLGFLKLISGSFDNGNTSTLTSSIEYIELEGNMSIKRLLGGNTLKVPGVNGSKFPPVSWDPLDCVLGYFNMTKTPTMRVVRPYRKYGCTSSNEWIYRITDPLTRHVRGYAGKFKKYQLDEDLELVWYDQPGLDLIDVHFAIVCKPNGTGNRLYSIQDPSIARYRHVKYSTFREEEDLDVPNPIYQDLEKGRFVIHKFDPDPSKIIYGTPYIKMDQFKGIVFEVPEDTDVKIRVVAKFRSRHYTEPLIFQNDYNFDVVEENPHQNILFCNQETNIAYNTYYPTTTYLSLGPGNYTETYRATTIELVPGFNGYPDFIAEALESDLPTRGNTVIRTVNYSCNSG